MASHRRIYISFTLLVITKTGTLQTRVTGVHACSSNVCFLFPIVLVMNLTPDVRQ